MNATKTYSISGLSCNNCVAKVTQTLSPFANLVEVSLKPPQIKISGLSTSIAVLNEALKPLGNYAIGNEVIDASLKDSHNPSIENAPTTLATYKPLILVFVYILIVVLAVEIFHGEWMWHRFMSHFMAGFFLVFSFFKMLDLRGFASSYAMYDVLAKRLPIYGYIYPFIELALGAFYLLGCNPVLVNSVTLFVMVFSSIGVILAVSNKQKIRCACLGTGFNLPMTTVTIIEDLLMAAMAAYNVDLILLKRANADNS
jgi:copper chaperone CopZ